MRYTFDYLLSANNRSKYNLLYGQNSTIEELQKQAEFEDEKEIENNALEMIENDTMERPEIFN